MVETVELAGTVRAVSDPAPGSARLTIDGVTEVTNHSGWFELELGGTVVRIDARNCEVIGAPSRKVRRIRQEAFGQIWIPTDLARKFQVLQLALVEVTVGDRVEVAGIGTQRARAEGGYREVPCGEIMRVQATLVARGRQLSAARG